MTRGARQEEGLYDFCSFRAASAPAHPGQKQRRPGGAFWRSRANRLLTLGAVKLDHLVIEPQD